jgi:3-oxoacyl-[acyl-carrier-protein] synthase-1
MAPNGLFAHCAMLQAVEDARLTEADISNRQTGLYAASGGSPYLTHYHHERLLKQGVMRCSPLGIVASIVGTLNFNLVAAFKIQGGSCGFSSACASSAHALGYAFDDLTLGRQKRMFVVGAEDGNSDAILPFAGMRTLSLQTDPNLASRPFDAARDGFVGTGGGTVMVLETEEEVIRRGVTPYAELLGWGQASDGYNVAISHPEGHGSAASMKNALQAARLQPGEVDYVNAHATSTLIGDVSEARALRAVFGDAAARVAVSSTKALTGHGLSLAGVMESAFCCLALREGFIPGNAHLATVDPECGGLNLPRTTELRPARIVVKNSSGFGGANVALVFKRAA